MLVGTALKYHVIWSYANYDKYGIEADLLGPITGNFLWNCLWCQWKVPDPKPLIYLKKIVLVIFGHYLFGKLWN